MPGSGRWQSTWNGTAATMACESTERFCGDFRRGGAEKSLLCPMIFPGFPNRNLRSGIRSLALKKPHSGLDSRSGAVMVGLAGFEPTTSCTPCKRTTKLCYSPKGRMNRRVGFVIVGGPECKC